MGRKPGEKEKMADLGNIDDVGETLGYYHHRREGLSNFFIGLLTGVALVVGLLLLAAAIWGPGALPLPFLSSATPSPTATPEATETPLPSFTPTATDATPSPTETPACPAEYVVQANDYLSTIAERCGLTVEAILSANPTIPDANSLRAGDKIVLPPPGTGFTPTELPANIVPGTVINVMVRKGDTLQSIADKYLSTVDDIIKLNTKNLPDPNLLYEGLWLKVRYGIATPVPIRNSPTYGPTPTETPPATVAATSTRAP
jgi:LysM repeat protein